MKIFGINRSNTRMLQWLLLSMLAYALAAAMADLTSYGDNGLLPRMQTVLWKCGHLNLAAFCGYWVDRNAFSDRIGPRSEPMLHLRRAVIIGFTMVAFGLAL